MQEFFSLLNVYVYWFSLITAFIPGKVNDFGQINITIIVKISSCSCTLYLVLRELLYTFMLTSTWDMMMNNETDFGVLWKPVSVLMKTTSKVHFCGVLLFYSAYLVFLLLHSWFQSRIVHDLSAFVNPWLLANIGGTCIDYQQCLDTYSSHLVRSLF